MPKQHGIQDAGVSQSIESAESTNFIKVDWEKSPPRGVDHESARGGVDPCLFGAIWPCDLVAGVMMRESDDGPQSALCLGGVVLKT